MSQRKSTGSLVGKPGFDIFSAQLKEETLRGISLALILHILAGERELRARNAGSGRGAVPHGASRPATAAAAGRRPSLGAIFGLSSGAGGGSSASFEEQPLAAAGSDVGGLVGARDGRDWTIFSNGIGRWTARAPRTRRPVSSG